MNWRGYITGLIIALAFFGASTDESSTAYNQEIVVRFNENSTAKDAKEAISNITSHLKNLGVEDFQISELVNGQIKVVYFSNLEVTVIKNLLSAESAPDFAYDGKNTSKFPFDGETQTYKFEVVKIQDNLDSDFGFQGILVESKSISDQYLKPKLSLASSEVQLNTRENFERADFPIFSKALHFKNNSSYRIPQVRAGPIS